MRNRILEIIDKVEHRKGKYLPPEDRQRIMAKEIDVLTKEHYFEFVTWVALDTYRDFEPPVMFDTKPNHSEIVWYNYEQDKDFTLDELYNYWLINYKKK